MNILSISAEKANYVPKKIYATSVSGKGGNPNGATAKEIANGILNRKIFAAFPIEMFDGFMGASRNGDTAMLTRIEESMNNLRGSTLLRLLSEAEEGSLMQKLINERLYEFIEEFGNPIPNYTPFIPPSTGAVSFGVPETQDGYNLAESLIQKSSAQFAAMANSRFGRTFFSPVN